MRHSLPSSSTERPVSNKTALGVASIKESFALVRLIAGVFFRQTSGKFQLLLALLPQHIVFIWQLCLFQIKALNDRRQRRPHPQMLAALWADIR